MSSGPRSGTGGTGLAKWFLAIYLVTSSQGGIAASELQRQPGFGSYQTAPSRPPAAPALRIGSVVP